MRRATVQASMAFTTASSKNKYGLNDCPHLQINKEVALATSLLYLVSKRLSFNSCHAGEHFAFDGFEQSTSTSGDV